jgi:hypothetical protein
MMPRPEHFVRLVSVEPEKKTLLQKLGDFVSGIFKPDTEAEDRRNAEWAKLLTAKQPVPRAPMRSPMLIRPQQAKISGSPTKIGYDAPQHLPVCASGNIILYEDLVFGRYSMEEWNDMEEEEREEVLEEWNANVEMSEHDKISNLATFGIQPPVPIDPQEAAVRRMHERAVANNLARDMEAHKKKLELELAEAEEREKHYTGNAIFGAF